MSAAEENVTPPTDITQHVESMEAGPQVGAFFDFDGTLISGFSALVFLREQLRAGHISATDLVELVATMANLTLGRVDFPAAMALSVQILRGVEERSYDRFGEEVYRKYLAALVYPEARALVQAHLDKGHTVAIVSSATIYQVRAAARDLVPLATLYEEKIQALRQWGQTRARRASADRRTLDLFGD